MTKLTVAFRNFANAPKNLSSRVIGNNITTGFSDYLTLYSDTSANEDTSFRNHIR